MKKKLLVVTEINISGVMVEVSITRNEEGNIEIEPTDMDIFKEGGYLENGHACECFEFEIKLLKV